MKELFILCHNETAGLLSYNDHQYCFQYIKSYRGPPISLTMPKQDEPYIFNSFPPFFDGLLPEGIQLEGLLKIHKLDRTDYMGQLEAVGRDLVGAITVQNTQ